MKPTYSPSEKICRTIDRLRLLTQVDVQGGWRYYSEDLKNCLKNIRNEFCQELKIGKLQLAQLNDKGYVTWGAGNEEIFLVQRIIIPETVKGYPIAGLVLRLKLTWWAEVAQIFVNGTLKQEGDLFDSSARVVLSESATPGEEIIVVLRLLSPGHDIGALMRSQCVYEKRLAIDPGFVADELSVLHQYITAFEPDKLEIFAAEIAKIDWDILSEAEAFESSLKSLRDRLIPLSQTISQRCIHLLGHAHLDMAWLWTTKETIEVAQRTFESVLSLQQDFPYLTFCHTTPALYAQIEKKRPDLFAAITEAVKKGVWEVLGGMWVEPEVNIVNGESLVRQLLYGQQYIKEKFGAITKIAWLPDSFGFCASLPQILRQSGIEYFVTGKLHWNDTNKFPHGVFWWRSPDGTKILTLMSPPNLTGVMDINPVTTANYAIDWETQTGLKDAFWLPGVGDHGGGPTRDMLEMHQRASQSPFFPRLKFNSALSYLQQVDRLFREDKNKDRQLPVWNEELYLELHRGCYTNHADQKRFNRRCEDLLYQAELWACLASIISSQDENLSFSHPQAEIEKAWKKVLFNQFHDILPGTSIEEVFIEANQAWEEVDRVGNKILSESLSAIASTIKLPSPPLPDAIPIFVFNSLNWKRSQVVACEVTEDNWEIYDLEGQKLLSQRSHEDKRLFLAEDIPSIGYRVFWLCRSRRDSRSRTQQGNDAEEVFGEKSEAFILENEKLRVTIDSVTGELSSVFDKINLREILSGTGNQLQAFQDKGQYWDAWNIDPNYEAHSLPPTELKSIQWLEYGPIQWRVRVVRQLGKSEFSSDYILQIDSPLLKIANTVNWQETHVLVKAAFPFTVESDSVTCEIPGAAISRPTRPQTSLQKAKWEIPAIRWADLTSSSTKNNICQEYGVSLLNDCKYGYDIQPNRLRLSLLRGSTWPDPTADRGMHQFTYALYPHSGSWQSAKTVRLGYELNIPLIVRSGENIENNFESLQGKKLPAVGRLLDLGADNLILMALKPAEDGVNTWILRCYECHGEEAELFLQGDLDLKCDRPLDLLERPLQQDINLSPRLPIVVQPWKIVSFQIE